MIILVAETANKLNSQQFDNDIDYNTMQIQIKIEEEKFRLSIGKAYNDWVWLAHYASRVYARTIYPQGIYIPALLYLQTKNGEYHPHPRERIKFYLENYQLNHEDVTVIIKIRKANHIFTEYQKKWEAQAFGEDRYFSEIKFAYKVSNINRKKDFFFKVRVYFNISEDIKNLVNQKKFLSVYEVQLKERQISNTDSLFEGSIKLPYGTITHRLFYLQRESFDEEYSEHELRDHKLKNEDFKVSVEPRYIPQDTVAQLVQEDMRISQNINKNLQEKQLQAKKRNTNSSLCCFSFEQLWTIVEQQYGQQLYLQDYEQSTKQRIRITIQKSLNELYEIFFYYFIVENQQRDKKEDLAITYQHILHFLRDYQIFTDLNDLLGFLEFYNSDNRFHRLDDTLDVEGHGIKFPQFIAILLRGIQFLQTSTFMLKGETFDSAVVKILQRIIEVETEQEQFSEFRRNIRENAKIISYIRSSSEQIKRIYCHQAQNSIQNSAREYCLKKEELKRMLQIAAITEKNTDVIIEQCFNELKLREEGLFYYDFLAVLQWLALATISSQKEEDIDNEEEQSMLIVEKLKYLIDKIASLS